MHPRERGKISIGRSDADDVDDLATVALAELDGACRECEERVIVAAADVRTGVELGSALADDDLAGLDDLAAEALDARYCGFESRPLRVELTPFLLDMSGVSSYLMFVIFRRVRSWRWP